METINPLLAAAGMLLLIFVSGAAGVYLRYTLRNNSFVRSGKSAILNIALLVLSIIAALCAAGLHWYGVLVVISMLAVACLAYTFWDANPTWEEG